MSRYHEYALAYDRRRKRVHALQLLSTEAREKAKFDAEQGEEFRAKERRGFARQERMARERYEASKQAHGSGVDAARAIKKEEV